MVELGSQRVKMQPKDAGIYCYNSLSNVCHRKFRGILITVLIARYTIM
jgi:hypothetical protein